MGLNFAAAAPLHNAHINAKIGVHVGKMGWWWMMDIHMLAGPVIGAVIGYCTNYIAVKMMFRPLHPVKIGSWTVPFTPGIIPKGKSQLAKAVGEAVGKNLLTEDSFAESLLSPAIEEHLRKKIRLFLYENRKNEKTVKELLLEYLEEPVYEAGFENVKNMVTERLTAKILEMDLGSMIAEEAVKAVKERLGGGFMSMFLKDSIMDSLKGVMAEEIELYLDEHANELLSPKVEAELKAAMDTKTGSLITRLDECDLPIEDILWNAYAALVRKKLGAALRRVNISHMVEEKIDRMDMLEMEELVLSVMKKQLNAVVNLGAVIGFVLGILNTFF